MKMISLAAAFLTFASIAYANDEIPGTRLTSVTFEGEAASDFYASLNIQARVSSGPNGSTLKVKETPAFSCTLTRSSNAITLHYACTFKMRMHESGSKRYPLAEIVAQENTLLLVGEDVYDHVHLQLKDGENTEVNAPHFNCIAYPESKTAACTIPLDDF